MRGPRNATPYQADLYRTAVKRKNRLEFQTLIRENREVLWESITKDLSPEDMRWARDNMPEPEPDDSGGYFGA